MRIIVAEMEAVPERRAELLEVLDGLLEPSRAEPGCISYRYFFDSENPNIIHFFELWADQAAVDFHFATPHFQALSEKLPNLIVGDPNLSIYEAAAVS
ncbi:MAG: putative quinol monooxygenase [Planctomycetota bacterium]|jgi:quinol monooxygenase YgiN|nr:putative quinol monooxygenase [Planctomycetota bacterium]